MGKKKSVVLMTLITIVILVLCAVVACPSFVIPGSNGIKKWNPTAMQYDLGTEFSGGHYAYYYPENVITETEYNDDLGAYDIDGEEAAEYKAKYQKYGSLYLSTDPDHGILENGVITEGFKAAFQKTLDTVAARYAARAQKTGSTYRVSVVDDYAIRVELSATEISEGQDSATYALQTFSTYAQLGVLTIETGTEETTELVEEMKTDGKTAADLIHGISTGSRYGVSFVHITFTPEGREMLKAYKDGEDTAMVVKIGGETLLTIDKTKHITTKNEVEYGVAENSESLNADTLCVLLNSAMNGSEIYINAEREEVPMRLQAPARASEIATYAPVYGDNLIWVFVAIVAVLVILCVAAVLTMGGFGVTNIYASLTYFVITAICFAFVSGGVFAVDFGSVLMFLVGLWLVNALNARVYSAIKKEVNGGKTVQSSVKGGYNKTQIATADIYAVLALGAVALLLGVASMTTFACQALICLAAGAFCNLLWGRVINYMLLSISKDKYKYFRFVREEDEEDDE